MAPMRRASGAFCVALLVAGIGPSGAQAQTLLQQTLLLDARTGSSRAALAQDMAQGGYELSDGTEVDFVDWYSPRLPEMTVKLLTAMTPSFGMIWGVSTGERGEKYRIDPGIWLGFVYRHDLTTHSTVSLTASTLIGGDFREKTCQAYYQITSSEETVNCRLAASVLPPEDTLNFLERRTGLRESRAMLRYELRF